MLTDKLFDVGLCLIEELDSFLEARRQREQRSAGNLLVFGCHCLQFLKSFGGFLQDALISIF